MNHPEIIVVGSTNMDMVVKADHIPVPGETVIAGSFFMNPGGKGANQAVAIARLGGSVAFVSKLGNDVFGKQSSQLFDEEGIDTRFLLSDPEFPSGVALITVDKEGENSIVVAAGANANLFADDLKDALNALKKAQLILMQLEIPMETVRKTAEFARANGIKVILNPAPFSESLSKDVLKHIDVITPNQTEAEMLSGVKITTMEDAEKAARIIHDMGIPDVIITMGPEGAVLFSGGVVTRIPATRVTAVDTTAAGDVFNGALAVALSEARTLEAAVAFACDAAAISVTRMGAQSSIPYRNEMIVRMIK
ncbi:ribokinase [Niabella beijingensis]|uniref:ribokinase n=1 Tax=Niabella beijingensis TaxID=2872700 RepID=UPI001CBFBFEC|nr:ribokinase [Niabella beijingensis]MBZ4188880.1 ribokinase [Niabella beijingensis]